MARLNRFAALVVLDGRETMVHVANSGRMKELLAPENPMLVALIANAANRKTAYDLALVDLCGTLVSADARLPNLLTRESIEKGQLVEFQNHDSISSEVRLGESRIDLMLKNDDGVCYVETKSVTLVENGVALFPDAPTERGRKHLLSLQEAVGQGHRAAVVFVIQRDDARAFSPNEPADSRFTQTLREASKAGVEVYAYKCYVSRQGIAISGRVEVMLGGDG